MPVAAMAAEMNVMLDRRAGGVVRPRRNADPRPARRL